MTTSETFHVALHVGLVTLRLSEGCIAEVNIEKYRLIELIDLILAFVLYKSRFQFIKYKNHGFN